MGIVLNPFAANLSLMKWNWQLDGWGTFFYNQEVLAQTEADFVQKAIFWQGRFSLLSGKEKDELTISLLSDEAIQTSQIEGEVLDRESVQVSLRRLFGLQVDSRRVGESEFGIAEMMVDMYRSFHEKLTSEQLFLWHKMLTNGRRDLLDIGKYRSFDEPMQIVSGVLSSPNIHFEAPPSGQVVAEMKQFFLWLEESGPGGANPLSAITRAGIAHVYFESIHPFEDGNGRIGRAISEKLLSQAIGFPSLISLAETIEKHKKAYYAQLEKASYSNELDEWLEWFAAIVTESLMRTNQKLDFMIHKIGLFTQMSDKLNPRQHKVLRRLFEAGIDGFPGGLSAKNYCSISGASEATTTRDLTDLVAIGALKKTGAKKSTRYYLDIPNSPTLL